MVTVREDYPLTPAGKVDLESWAARTISIAGLTESAGKQLQKAAQSAYLAEQQTKSADNKWSEGASSFLTGLEMAYILAEFSFR